MRSCLLIFLAAFALGAISQAGPAPSAALPPSLQPFWAIHTMDREPLLFVAGEGEWPASARLLFTPDGPPRITGPAGAPVFEQGTDFIWNPGSSVLTLTKGSRIPYQTNASLHPPRNSPHAVMGDPADVKSNLLCPEYGFFQAHQVEATYDHAEIWTAPKNYQPTVRLTAAIDKLKSKSPLKFVVLGDCISAGFAASGFIRIAPYQPSYPSLVVDGLKSYYGLPAGTITLANLAASGELEPGGECASSGVAAVPRVVAEHPDVLMIAFGMFDAYHGIAPDVFEQNIRDIIAGVRKVCPDTQFIVIASMVGNPEWKPMWAGLIPAYRDQLANLTGPGVALADVTAVWQRLTQTKKFTDLTGDGVNLPNDFGHRLYAQVILQSLIPPN